MGTIGLIAAISGGFWLYSSKQSETERYRKIWEIEAILKTKGYAIFLVPGRGVAVYAREKLSN